MAKSTAQNCVLYIERNKVSIYHPGFKTIAEVDIPETAVKDLEIKKMSELEKVFSSVLGQNKFPTTDPFFIILGEGTLLVEKLPNATKQSAKEQIEAELKLAPFNHVGWTSIQNGKDLILIMVNRELYEGAQEILERLGFRVAAVTVITTLGLPQAPFSSQLGKEILSHAALVRQNSMIFDPEQAQQAENAVSPDPRRNKKLMALLVVLGVSVLVLGGFVIKMVVFPDKPAQTKEPAPTAAPAQSVSTMTPTPVASVSALPALNEVRIQVLNASGEVGLADKTRLALSEDGFKLVDTGNSEIVTSEKIQIIFAPSVSTPVREAVVGSLGKTYPEQAVREASPSGNYDVVITLTAK